MDLRSILRQITPPIALTGWRKLRQRFGKQAPAWEFVGYEWPDDIGAAWNAPGVVDSYQRKLPEFRRAIAVPSCIGVPTEALLASAPSQYDQNLALQCAYAVACARATGDSIRILDWGGGFGFMSFIIEELYPDLAVDHHVKEVAAVATAARVAVPTVTFWEDDACLRERFDLIIASSSFQYEVEWMTTLHRFRAAARHILLQRLPVTPGARSFVARQWAYGTNYAGWTFSRNELLSGARSAGLELQREFLEGWVAPIPHAPSPNEHRAYLFVSSR